MARVLIQFAHPAFEKSRVNRRLWRAIADLDGVTRNDLYEAYPDFDVDVEREQELLLAHDVILFQHPLHWYSTPALLKQWMDLVLTHGWAYGSGGTALAGKRWTEVVTTGGGQSAYQHQGLNRYTLEELLKPLEQTARLCHMEFTPPFTIHGTHRMEEAEIEAAAAGYRRFVAALRDERGALAVPADREPDEEAPRAR